ncbi:HD domain-containing protein [Epibacterium ulvae]|uniref:HD domain-containing protein n=1 Tax=Epibacterium ulvae TaxID=1156985 RepID=UPI00249145B8|nr:HD domain-containing protein [Epibacterium ulvae]
MRPDIDDQFKFLNDIEKLRGVQRNNRLLDGSRQENSAEHSWHLALFALTLADYAPRPINPTRVMQMLLLHDVVEIDVGDHPIHLQTDWKAIAAAEQKAAMRIFGQLPQPQGKAFLSLWQEFEAATSADAVFAKVLDFTQPLTQVVFADTPSQEHIRICREAVLNGRSMRLKDDFPEVYQLVLSMLDGNAASGSTALLSRLAFLNEADKLKSIYRASKLSDGSRHENSAEHSWHIMLYAWVLAEHAEQPVDLNRVLMMLLLHDLVEIDAGDTPIHGKISAEDLAALEASEDAAATRIFGLLPTEQGAAFLQIWREFEAAESEDARFAKAIDRVQPLTLNLANGGGSWVEYNVSMSQLNERVGRKVENGAPAVWAYMKPIVQKWFQANVH